MMDQIFEYDDIELSIEERELIRLDQIETRNLSQLKGYEFDNRYVADKEGNVYLIKQMVKGEIYGLRMLPYNTRDHYVEYVLTTKHKTKKHIQGQRIVAGLFIANHSPDKIHVNHKDGNRSNNKVNNLEWVTISENIKHSWDYLRRR